MSYATDKLWIDTYINTNGVKAITGARGNQAFVERVLNMRNNLYYDTTRPYIVGDIMANIDGVFTDLYLCSEAHGPGDFDSTKWVRISVRKKAITATLDGTDVITHGLGFKPINIYVESATGENIPFNVTQSDATTTTFETLGIYTDAIINFIA